MSMFSRFFLFGALFALGAALIPPGGTQDAQAQPESPTVSGEILVKFRPGTPGQAVADEHRAQQAQVRSTIGRIDVQVVQVPPGREVAAAAAYKQNPNVQFAEPNRVYEAITHTTYPQDPQFHQQWQYENTGQNGGTNDADIDAYEAWNTAGVKGKATVNVAVLDTGIDSDHEDLAVAQSKNFTTSSTSDDRYGHGTHVAGSVAAKTNNATGVTGTCPECSLWSYKVLNDRGSGQWDWIAQGIITAADDGAHVINLSLGGYTPSDTLRAAVDYAWDPPAQNSPPTKQRAVIAAAAGNDGQNWGFYPAVYDNVIAVGATDNKDLRASFSNYGGNWVDVAAPGTNILSTAPREATSIWRSGTNGYASLNGTSMATPHVAGVAGLVWSSGKCGAQDNKCVRDQIETTAQDHPPGTGSNFTIHGRVNAAAAVGGSTAAPTPDTTITNKPAAITNSTSANFGYSSSITGSTFECQLDAASWTSCPATGTSFSNLSVQNHTFQVRAQAGGVIDPSPASHTWTVDTAAPDTTLSNPPSTSGSSVSFTFSSTESSSTFQCKLDSETFAACTSPKSYSGLGSGSHIFTVAATDAAGNADMSPASHTWTVSTSSSTPTPTLTVTGVTPGSMNAGSQVGVEISGTGFVSGAGVTFENGSGNTPKASAIEVVGDGKITAQVSVGSGGPRRERVWDVRVTNPNGASAVLPGQFRVTPS
jgi:thermitase